MGRSDRDARCMKHPDHRQSMGVCPYCLRKRLSQLRFSSSSLASSLSVSSSDDSELSSYSVSPPSFRKKTIMASLFKRGSSSRAPFVKPRVTIAENRSLVLAVGEEQLSETDDSELSSYSVSPPSFLPSFRKKTMMASLFKRGSSSRAPFVKPRVTIAKNRSLVLAMGEEQLSETDDSELSSYSVSPPSFRKKTMMASLFKRGSSSRASFVKPQMTIAKSRSLVLAVGEEQLAETESPPKRDGKKGWRSPWFKLLRGGSGWSKRKDSNIRKQVLM